MEIIISATIFKAFDGKIFTSENECAEYEKKRKEFLNKLKFFLVKYAPDLTETGFLLDGLFVAVYSDHYQHKEIATNYCIKEFGYLGESVQGHGFQTYFSVSETDFDTYTKGVIEDYKGIHRYDKLFLSPKELDEFKGIERFDYMKEWGFK